MYDFTYHRPTSIADAKKIVGEDEFATLLAGGMTLLPTMKMRLAQTDDLVDLNGVDELAGICIDGDAVIIGAMTRHADVAASDDVRSRIPALAYLASQIGDAQVRNRGTIGGSLANNDPAADYPGAVLGLGATVITDQREIAADDYFQGMFETALEPGEIITAVRFPVPKRAAYAKFPNPASRYAVVGVFVADTASGVRVAVTGAGPCVFRQTDMETALGSDFTDAAIEGVSVDASALNEDLHASADYRANLVKVMAKRAVAAAGG
jgi:carbon-monoxide dehydrogenase medium subunit